MRFLFFFLFDDQNSAYCSLLNLLTGHNFLCSVFKCDICTSVVVVPEAPLYTVLSGVAKQLTSDDIFSVLSIKDLMMKALL